MDKFILNEVIISIIDVDFNGHQKKFADKTVLNSRYVNEIYKKRKVLGISAFCNILDKLELNIKKDVASD